jgi:hypothetical protein
MGPTDLTCQFKSPTQQLNEQNLNRQYSTRLQPNKYVYD